MPPPRLAGLTQAAAPSGRRRPGTCRSGSPPAAGWCRGTRRRRWRSRSGWPHGRAGSILKSPPTIAPLGTTRLVPIRIAETRRAWIRLAVDVHLDQLGQDTRALRMADEDDASAMVLVREVVVPGVAHVGVGRDRARRRGGRWSGGHGSAQGGQGELAVHRRVEPAALAEARELLGRPPGAPRPRPSWWRGRRDRWTPWDRRRSNRWAGGDRRRSARCWSSRRP